MTLACVSTMADFEQLGNGLTSSVPLPPSRVFRQDYAMWLGLTDQGYPGVAAVWANHGGCARNSESGSDYFASWYPGQPAGPGTCAYGTVRREHVVWAVPRMTAQLCNESSVEWGSLSCVCSFPAGICDPFAPGLSTEACLRPCCEMPAACETSECLPWRHCHADASGANCGWDEEPLQCQRARTRSPRRRPRPPTRHRRWARARER